MLLMMMMMMMMMMIRITFIVYPFMISVGGAVASWLVRSTHDVRALAVQCVVFLGKTLNVHNVSLLLSPPRCISRYRRIECWGITSRLTSTSLR